jgi:predicted TIM-barrel fold metal-dependent hydrolase
MTTIDSHLHVWDLDHAAYPWLGPHLAPIHLGRTAAGFYGLVAR